ncbi:hypothetical protein FOZ61_007772 [Perkinsus olseni]|uniref:Replication factor A protein 3 n=1 Tax=Perkinsus olseni TaxID=32597 RepID=A0A7J6L7E5_PEROL|nr:hypothetical protein FOZ61_007772 [Perkinsus olseni]KAF4658280.1 hypothetical protein FOL46_007038 [Perkinsus olseni]
MSGGAPTTTMGPLVNQRYMQRMVGQRVRLIGKLTSQPHPQTGLFTVMAPDNGDIVCRPEQGFSTVQGLAASASRGETHIVVHAVGTVNSDGSLSVEQPPWEIGHDISLPLLDQAIELQFRAPLAHLYAPVSA